MVRSLQNRDRTARRLVEQEESAGELVEDDYATKLAKLDERLASGTISRDRYNDWRARLERNRDELLDDSNGARRLMSATLNSGYVGTNSAVKINPQ